MLQYRCSLPSLIRFFARKYMRQVACRARIQNQQARSALQRYMKIGVNKNKELRAPQRQKSSKSGLSCGSRANRGSNNSYTTSWDTTLQRRFLGKEPELQLRISTRCCLPCCCEKSLRGSLGVARSCTDGRRDRDARTAETIPESESGVLRMVSNKMLLWMPRVLATPPREEYDYSREGVYQLPLSQRFSDIF